MDFTLPASRSPKLRQQVNCNPLVRRAKGTAQKKLGISAGFHVAASLSISEGLLRGSSDDNYDANTRAKRKFKSKIVRRAIPCARTPKTATAHGALPDGARHYRRRAAIISCIRRAESVDLYRFEARNSICGPRPRTPVRERSTFARSEPKFFLTRGVN